jgi:phosphatidate cytidylyltransferase
VPRNPFADPLFWPVFLRVLFLILVGLAAVVLSQRRSLRVWRRSTLFLRARTWFVIGPLFVVAVFVGGFVAFLLAAWVVVQSCSEFVRIAGIERRYAYLLIVWGGFGLLVAALARDFFVFLPFGFFILLTLVPILSGQITDAHRQVADTLVGYVFVALPMALIVLVKSTETWGLEFLLIVTVSVAVSDIAAYATGSALRGRKLMPRVDPTKTWGGVLGNLVGAAVGVGLLWVAVPPEWSIAAVVVLVLVIAAGSVWADLTGSFIQRAFRTEVRSTVVLGYGGVINRVDSLLMAFPLSYYSLLLVDKVVSWVGG